MGALSAPTSMALTCRWRSRPQHQKRTYAVQQTEFDYLVEAGEQRKSHSKAEDLGGLEVDDQAETPPLAAPIADIRRRSRYAVAASGCSLWLKQIAVERSQTEVPIPPLW